MMGDKIGDETGKVTGRRVLSGEDPRYVKMEITFEAQSTVYGVAGMNVGTYTVMERIPGQLYGEGQGIFMGMGGESAIWNGAGVGRMDESGALHFAAAVSFQTNADKLMNLNGCMAMVEHSTDMQGNAKSVLYEWKA